MPYWIWFDLFSRLRQLCGVLPIVSTAAPLLPPLPRPLCLFQILVYIFLSPLRDSKHCLVYSLSPSGTLQHNFTPPRPLHGLYHIIQALRTPPFPTIRLFNPQPPPSNRHKSQSNNNWTLAPHHCSMYFFRQLGIIPLNITLCHRILLPWAL